MPGMFFLRLLTNNGLWCVNCGLASNFFTQVWRGCCASSACSAWWRLHLGKLSPESRASFIASFWTQLQRSDHFMNWPNPSPKPCKAWVYRVWIVPTYRPFLFHAEFIFSHHFTSNFAISHDGMAWDFRLWCVIEKSWLPARPSHPGLPGLHHGYGGSTHGAYGLWCNSLCWAFSRWWWWSAYHDRCDHWEPKTIGYLPLGSDKAKGACCARAWFWGTSWPLFPCGKLLCKTRTGAAPVECFQLQTHSEIRCAFSMLWPLLPWSIFTPNHNENTSNIQILENNLLLKNHYALQSMCPCA